MKTYKVAVIGLGYVGLPLAVLINKKGNNVIGIDIDQQKLEKIKKGISPIIDKRVDSELKSAKLHVTSSFESISNKEIIIICVPTPINEDKTPDYSHLISACESIGKFLQKDQLIVVESTVNPGTTEEIIIPVLEKSSQLKAGSDFSISHIPERLNPGDEIWHVGNIPRVVGGLNTKSLNKTISFYKSIIDAEIFSLESLKEAEAVKIVENCFRDINIAFVNELAMSFSHLEINLSNVIKGASTKPFSFLAHYPGCGVGGHCIPVDPYYLINYTKNNGFQHDFLLAARKINNKMPRFTVEQLFKSMEEQKLTKKEINVCVLGLTYKENVNDTRESPAYEILRILEEEGIKTTTHDPLITKESLEVALENVHAVIIATAHNQYKVIKPEYFINKGIQIIIDGRNCLELSTYKDSSLNYRGIGC